MNASLDRDKAALRAQADASRRENEDLMERVDVAIGALKRKRTTPEASAAAPKRQSVRPPSHANGGASGRLPTVSTRPPSGAPAAPRLPWYTSNRCRHCRAAVRKSSKDIDNDDLMDRLTMKKCVCTNKPNDDPPNIIACGPREADGRSSGIGSSVFDAGCAARSGIRTASGQLTAPSSAAP